jgi:hypothetical protein
MAPTRTLPSDVGEDNEEYSQNSKRQRVSDASIPMPLASAADIHVMGDGNQGLVVIRCSIPNHLNISNPTPKPGRETPLPDRFLDRPIDPLHRSPRVSPGASSAQIRRAVRIIRAAGGLVRAAIATAAPSNIDGRRGVDGGEEGERQEVGEPHGFGDAKRDRVSLSVRHLIIWM